MAGSFIFSRFNPASACVETHKNTPNNKQINLPILQGIVTKIMCKFPTWKGKTSKFFRCKDAWTTTSTLTWFFSRYVWRWYDRSQVISFSKQTKWCKIHPKKRLNFEFFWKWTEVESLVLWFCLSKGSQNDNRYDVLDGYYCVVYQLLHLTCEMTMKKCAYCLAWMTSGIVMDTIELFEISGSVLLFLSSFLFLSFIYSSINPLIN